MFEQIGNMFNGVFAPIKADQCRLSFSGYVAVKCSDGTYKCWNDQKSRLTNVTSFSMKVPNMFFVVPTNKVKIGDVILDPKKVNGETKVFPKCVIGVDDKSIEVIDYENNEIRKILPVRHELMGSFYLYQKIVNPFSNKMFKGKTLMAKFMNMQAMSYMCGGAGFGGFLGTPTDSKDQANLANNPVAMMASFASMQYMMKSMGDMFGGGDEGIFNMFGMDLDFNDSDESAESEGEEEVPETPKAKSKVKAKK